MATNAELKKQLAEQKAANKKLAELAAKKKVGGIPVEGKYLASNGAKYSFLDGNLFVREATGIKLLSTEVINMANDSNYKFPEDALKTCPALGGFSHKEAKELMERLVAIGYGYLKLVEPAKEEDPEKTEG